MYSGRIITVRATVNGKKRVKKLGEAGAVDLTAARKFARKISSDYRTRSVLQAESVMGSEATRLATYEDGLAVQE